MIKLLQKLEKGHKVDTGIINIPKRFEHLYDLIMQLESKSETVGELKDCESEMIQKAYKKQINIETKIMLEINKIDDEIDKEKNKEIDK